MSQRVIKQAGETAADGQRRLRGRPQDYGMTEEQYRQRLRELVEAAPPLSTARRAEIQRFMENLAEVRRHG